MDMKVLTIATISLQPVRIEGEGKKRGGGGDVRREGRTDQLAKERQPETPCPDLRRPYLPFVVLRDAFPRFLALDCKAADTAGTGYRGAG